MQTQDLRVPPQDDVDVKPLTPDDDEYLLPCGHSVRQARVLTGCTMEQCRPLDEKISQEWRENNPQ